MVNQYVFTFDNLKINFFQFHNKVSIKKLSLKTIRIFQIQIPSFSPNTYTLITIM